MVMLLACVQAQAVDISATGGWTETIDASDLAGGAGTNLIDNYESAAAATILEVYGTGVNDWYVDVTRSDITWHGDFTLYVKRISDGTGSGWVANGIAYIAIETVDSDFFNGNGDRSNINVQYRLTGMSVSVPPGMYSTTVTYTVTE